MRDIGKNILQLRVRQNLTQDELAERLFVTRQTVSNYETGKSRPDIEMLMHIAEVLETDVNELLYGNKQQRYIPRSFWLGLGATLLLGCIFFFYRPAAEFMQKHHVFWAIQLLRLHVVPLYGIVFGWTAMCGIGIIIGAKPIQKSWAVYLRWAIYSLLIAYFVLMTPAIIDEVKSEIVYNYINELRESIGNPSSAYHSSFALRPQCLNVLMGDIWILISSKESVFAVIGGLLWLSGLPKKGEKNYILLLVCIALTLVLYFSAEQEFVLEIENPELYQNLPYGIEAIAPEE